MNIKQLLLIITSVSFLFACKKDETQNPENETPKLLSFKIIAEKNKDLPEDISGKIEGNTVKFTVSDAVDISSLVPTIEISEEATIDPGNETPVDFTKEVKYTVTSQDGATKVEYNVEVATKSSDKKITKFQFTVNSYTFDANIDNKLFEITLKLPYYTDLSNLAPTIEINNAASASIYPSSGEAQDFNNAITYEITAGDGSRQKYTANITTMTATENDRAVLEELYNLNKGYNPSSYLNWDLEADNMEAWEGIGTSTYGGETRVNELNLENVHINELPKRIGELFMLSYIRIENAHLKELPNQIGNLRFLRTLILSNNELKSIPEGIKGLYNLVYLYLDGNQLEALPAEIGKLYRLALFDVSKNNLKELPVEIAELTFLQSLDIKNNPLTEIQQVICDMKTSSGTEIYINKDTDDICN